MRSNRIRTTALAATALLAALSLTACSDNGSSDSGKAGSPAPAANTAAKQSPSAAPEKGATDTGTGSTSGNNAPPAKNDGKSGTNATNGMSTAAPKGQTGSTASRTPVTCAAENTKVTVSKVTRPINHLLLTVTNAGSRPCYAYNAPKLRFDDAQAVFPILDDSRPQAVVTLDPGQSAYASIGLTGEPGSGPAPREATRLQVHFSGKNPGGSTGSPAELTLPANTSWDDNGFVTFWQTEMADALTY